MNQPELTLDAPPVVTATTPTEAPRSAGVPCQNPGCPHHIVPADASDERCPDCGHAIRDEEVMCNAAASDGPDIRPDTTTGASHKRPAKAPASPPDPAGPRSIAARIVSLAQQLALTDAEQGELNVLLSREMNTGSPKLLDWLYGDVDKGGCGFPPRFKKAGGKNTNSLARSTDALLATFRMNRDERLRLCLMLIGLKKQISTLNLDTDKDGRVRYSINIAGTMVGRMACSKSATGSGTNMTTISDRHKHLFPADPGHDLYSVDLKGADGWTIGAECAQLGDPRMLDDLRAGLKPACAVQLLWENGQQVNQWPMAQCLEAQAKIDKGGWRYRATKIAIWSICYQAGDVTVSESILETSWKRCGELIYVSAADCKKLIAATYARYPGIKRRMERINMLLVRDGGLTNCAGFQRDFFGRKTDAATQRLAYAYTPAFNTATMCNAALLKLWQDLENIDSNAGTGNSTPGTWGYAHKQRIARPMLTVHDSVVFQVPVERREWVAARIPYWFDNPLTVAGLTFTIPYEIKGGATWGTMETI